MSVLSQHVQDYLTIRRALGFKLEFAGQVLPQFVAFVETRGASTVTVEHAIAWAGLPQGSVQPISLSHRLGAVRGFAGWLQTIDPRTEVPPRESGRRLLLDPSPICGPRPRSAP